MVVSAKFRPLLFCPVLLHSVPRMYPGYSFTEDWDKTTLQSSSFHSSLTAVLYRSTHHAPHRVLLSLPDRDFRSATHDSTITCCSVNNRFCSFSCCLFLPTFGSRVQENPASITQGIVPSFPCPLRGIFWPSQRTGSRVFSLPAHSSRTLQKLHPYQPQVIVPVRNRLHYTPEFQ